MAYPAGSSAINILWVAPGSCMAFLMSVAKPGGPAFPAVEAEHEFVEIGLQVLFP
jgi:hypothetical protein